MSFEQVKSAVSQLSEEQQDQLAAYLVHLRHQRDAKQRPANAPEHTSSQQWISLGELREKWKE